eukprot:TRINITY_DN9045_c0_g1_i1.p1 TRINITY_DN9045_c0_g1~~TRINITY_DN9045_c0_g1_i1.p1  ORF type:complete len:202 (-),score=45.60 TRINITY_DN9045_c0_g1_i1:123-704(-)
MPRLIALVCASNQNRSVEAHAALLKSGFTNVRSFGTSQQCKLPGPAIDKPNVFPFGTPYKTMYDTLREQNPDLYKANGILNMLERNMKVKTAPERFQDDPTHFDLIITFDQRVFDLVIDDLHNRNTDSSEPSHIVNLQVKDTHEEATIGASHTIKLIEMIEEEGDSWEDEMDSLLEKFQEKTARKVLHSLAFY